MKKILFINGGKAYGHSNGRYNETLHNSAISLMDRAGIDVQQTYIERLRHL